MARLPKVTKKQLPECKTHIHYHPLVNIKWFLHFDRGILMYFVAIVVFWVKLRSPRPPPPAQVTSFASYRLLPGNRIVLDRTKMASKVSFTSYLGGSGTASKIRFGSTQLPFFTTRLMLLMQKTPKSSCSKNGRFEKIQTAHPSANCKIDVSGISKC